MNADMVASLDSVMACSRFNVRHERGGRDRAGVKSFKGESRVRAPEVGRGESRRRFRVKGRGGCGDGADDGADE